MNRQSPIANRQSPIANRQSPIANRRQTPIANRRQTPIADKRQSPTNANRRNARKNMAWESMSTTLAGESGLLTEVLAFSVFLSFRGSICFLQVQAWT